MKKFIWFFNIFFVFYFFHFCVADAASLSIVTNKSQVVAGDTFEANVFVNSDGVAINSAGGVINFTTDLLNVVSVNNSASIFPVWVESPKYSNSDGTISFDGGVPTPGFNGSQGLVLKIVFLAKKAGNPQIYFSSANVYANDGLGSNVTNSKLGASVNIIGSSSTLDSQLLPTFDYPPSISTIALPKEPVINSSEAPDPNDWYSKTELSFYWDVPLDVNTVQLLLGSKLNSDPVVSYSPAIKKKTLTNLSDGVWYLHARFKNASGWGATAHRKIQIDTVSPKNIEATSSVDGNGILSLNITGEDELSGIKNYDVFLGEEYLLRVGATENNSSNFMWPSNKLVGGELRIVAYGKAGNSSEIKKNIQIPRNKAPEIDVLPEEIKIGEEIKISGKTYPNTEIIVWINDENAGDKKFNVLSDENGFFSLPPKIFENSGQKIIWAEIISDCFDVKCPISKKIQIQVKDGNLIDFLKEFTTKVNPYISINLIISIIILMAVLFTAFFVIKNLVSKPRRSDGLENEDVQKIFGVLKESAKRQRAVLDKRVYMEKLTSKEKDVLEDLDKDIEEAEKYFDKRIKKLSKDI